MTSCYSAMFWHIADFWTSYRYSYQTSRGGLCSSYWKICCFLQCRWCYFEYFNLWYISRLVKKWVLHQVIAAGKFCISKTPRYAWSPLCWVCTKDSLMCRIFSCNHVLVFVIVQVPTVCVCFMAETTYIFRPTNIFFSFPPTLPN
jgi:hypothetical protein